MSEAIADGAIRDDRTWRDKVRFGAFIFAIMMLLSGCGSSDKDRAVSGGGIGAGLGTAAGLLIGGPIGGFVLGGAVGTATGLVTDKDAIDLGDPVWNTSGNGQDKASLPSSDQEIGETFPDNGSESSTYDTDFRILN